MSEHAVSSCGAVAEHSVTVPGGTLFYRTQGSGPPLLLIGGGPSASHPNAVTRVTHRLR
jgi:pimeloyl-ACP methyl ester carboxylesterase